MSQTVRVYVKKSLRLDLLNIPQRQMYDLGVAGLGTVKQRVAKAYGMADAPAAPLKSESWKRIKKSKGLKPIRDLHGTGMMYTSNIAAFRNRVMKRKSKLKSVGHLMDQLLVRSVSSNRAVIPEPTTDAGRMKARRNRDMLGFSPFNRQVIVQAAQKALDRLKGTIIKQFSGSGSQR